MKYTYVDELRLNSKNRQQLVMINQVVEKYQRQGYRLSLRQLYYQLVTMNIRMRRKSMPSYQHFSLRVAWRVWLTGMLLKTA